MTLDSGLYVTATPIGNLKDITLRALEVLRGADFILCEDTRVTGKLCQAHDIKPPLKRYDDHNGAEMRPFVLEQLREGAAIALVSDAGTPLISDPGYKLIREARDAGLKIHTVPGASALTAALSISGAPTDRFTFAGFLPSKTVSRRNALAEMKDTPGTLVFYETGPRLAGTLKDIAAVLGERTCAIARELTKLHEEVREGEVTELADDYEQGTIPKGEIVLIIHPAEKKEITEDEVKAILLELLSDHSLKDAAQLAANDTGWPRKAVYSIALELKNIAT